MHAEAPAHITWNTFWKGHIYIETTEAVQLWEPSWISLSCIFCLIFNFLYLWELMKEDSPPHLVCHSWTVWKLNISFSKSANCKNCSYMQRILAKGFSEQLSLLNLYPLSGNAFSPTSFALGSVQACSFLLWL